MSRALRTFGVIAILALLASLFSAGSASAGEDTTDPMAGAPAVGDCYDLTYKQMYAHTVPEDPVDCASTHTAVVATVGKLPSGVTWNSPEKKTTAAVNKQCTRAVTARIGGNPVLIMLSAYSWMWYAPTQAEEDAGARWFSCLVIAPEDKALTDLPAPLPKASKHLPDELSKCFVGRKYLRTTCADRHDWRMSYSVLVHQKLTEKNLDRASQRYCRSHVSSRGWLRSAFSVTPRSFVLGCASETRR
jgi:hypothetical protein